MRNISRDSRIGAAIADCDWNYVTDRMQDRFDCYFDCRNVGESLSIERDLVMNQDSLHDFGKGWKDATWFIWLKSRVKFGVGESSEEEWSLNPLHFFFITIPEDMEMLGRLCEDGYEIKSGVARSRISSTRQYMNPINRTASLVVRKQ